MSALGVEGWPTPATERPVVLEARGLSVDYAGHEGAVRAVHDVDLVLRRGEVLGLAGESGSGKSTLAYAMTRLLRAPGLISGGQVTFHDGRPPEEGGVGSVSLLDAEPDQLRRLRWSEIAIVFQSALHALNPVISIEAQLTDVLAAHHRGATRSERAERAADLLALVGINRDRLRSYPHELSGGMRQRVMIAMALALDPQVVIMDEPTTALDVVTQREILDEITSLRDRLDFSVLFITHDLSLLIELADSIAVMYGGRIVEQGAAKEIYDSPRHPYTVGLVSSFPSMHGARRRLSGIPGSPPDLRNPPPGCAFHPRCPFSDEQCRSQQPALVPVPRLGPETGPGRLAACWHQQEAGVTDELAGVKGGPRR
ncbi:ABC transporter ATP-binding protein [Acidiferrimicrobium sp. IK]|uniref:ABC transporter ATP-binding protein n=1 Tax=Acidiferrimicrobium sp. IK TaxID=2871700 RepID=UPI0021CB5659|nr:ABC transporter ATP-binding protein [Acidiferrimicrobium sp. IK]MCU4186723.1 ABC transporter ATP-binding protein [Acidiferrimicrobium sp. IK]